ncbi:MAG: AAA family ATPase, partial [Cellulomonadaceae bacterium]|nr:AAA family ATPase [Cellulomonadaceae bacterium]
MDLFDALTPPSREASVPGKNAPLAVRMRPQNLDELVGQQHLTGIGSPLRQLLAPVAHSGRAVPASVILWGPPGTGKTTLAYLVSRQSDRAFVELSAVTAGVKDVREVIETARRRLLATGQETVLFIDEVHRFN